MERQNGTYRNCTGYTYRSWHSSALDVEHGRYKLMDFIISAIVETFSSFVKGFFTDILKWAITMLNEITFNFWDNSIIQAFLNFSMWVNWIIFGCSFLFALFDSAEEAGGLKEISWVTVMLNFFKGMLFTAFYSYLAIGIMQIANILAEFLQLDFVSPDFAFDGIFDDIASNVGIGILMIFFFIGIICFLVMSLKRFGTMFVQVFSAAFYIPDVVRGDTGKLGDWLRQTIAIAFTYTFQYILFYIGCALILFKPGIVETLIAISVWIGMFGVSHVLNKYGYSSGVRGGGASMMASQGLQLLTKV